MAHTACWLSYLENHAVFMKLYIRCFCCIYPPRLLGWSLDNCLTLHRSVAQQRLGGTDQHLPDTTWTHHPEGNKSAESVSSKSNLIRSFQSGYLPSRRQEYRSNLPATTINWVNLKGEKKSQNDDIWNETLPHSVPLSFNMEDKTDSTWKISQQAEEEAFFNSEGSKRLIFNWFSGISWHASSCPIKAGLDSHQRLDPSVWSYVNKMTRENRTSH